MKDARRRMISVGLAAGALVLAGAPQYAAVDRQSAPQSDAKPQPLRTGGRFPIYQGDVDFMTGMIPHHAQAIIMAGWAKSHGARKDVGILSERIVVAQTDEIKLMQTWLADYGFPVPDAKDTRMRMTMNGMQHDMLMPGMLSDEEMKALDKARGSEFDRLFLIGMIKHHQGALDMVEQLNKAYGAGQDETVFRFSSDVYADQSSEMDRMYQMLAVTPGYKGGDRPQAIGSSRSEVLSLEFEVP